MPRSGPTVDGGSPRQPGHTIDRRRFLQGAAIGLGALVVGTGITDAVTGERASPTVDLPTVTGSLTYPVTVKPPRHYVWLRSITRNGGAFYTNETGRVLNTVPPDLSDWTSTTTKVFTGNYYIRNYYGRLIASGKVTNATAIPIPDGLPCGGYRVYLTKSANDPNYGHSAGAGCFLIVNPDHHFQTLVGVPLSNFAIAGNADDVAMHGFTLQGPNRMTIDDPTNDGYLKHAITSIELLNTWYAPNPDSQRPRPYIVSVIKFVAQGTPMADLQSTVDTLSGRYGQKWYEGPMNEPKGPVANVVTNITNMSMAIKAVAPSARMMGVCTIDINDQTCKSGGYLYSILTDLAAAAPNPIDGISFHTYNCLNGDLLLGRTCFQELANMTSALGLSSLPLFDTEQGFMAMDYGVFEPRLQGRWTTQMLLLQEQFGLPKEHHILFSDSEVSGQTGSVGFPSNYSTRNTWFPAVAMVRAFSAEVWGMPATPTVLDFGTPGNNMMLGSVYTNPTTGDSLVALQSAGSTDLIVRFTVTGASSFTLVDCFGNTSTLTPSGGVLSVPTAMEPVYLRVPPRAKASLIQDWNFGTDLATLGTASASGSATNVGANAKIMVQGPIPSTYYYNSALTVRGERGAPYIDDTDGFPAWASVSWETPRALDTVLVIATAPWEAQGTLLDFDVQYLLSDGVTWRTATTINEPAKFGTVSDPTATEFGFVTYQGDVGCTVESYFSDRWVFYVPLGRVVKTQGIRVYVYNATFGKDACIQAKRAKRGKRGKRASTDFGNNFMLRQISAYNSAAP